MKKLLGFAGMFLGGWLGWYLGALASIFLAFVVSMVGTGAGLYFGHRLASRYF